MSESYSPQETLSTLLAREVAPVQHFPVAAAVEGASQEAWADCSLPAAAAAAGVASAYQASELVVHGLVAWDPSSSLSAVFSAALIFSAAARPGVEADYTQVHVFQTLRGSIHRPGLK